MVLVNVICKTKMFVKNAIEVCRIASSRGSDCGGDPPRDASKKRSSKGVGQRNAYFSRPTLPTKKANYWESKKGRPAENINMKVSGKVNLIFYKLNLFPIFLVDKVKKKRKKQKNCRLQDHEEYSYYHSGRCHAMRIQHQYANLSRILQF